MSVHVDNDGLHRELNDLSESQSALRRELHSIVSVVDVMQKIQALDDSYSTNMDELEESVSYYYNDQRDSVTTLGSVSSLQVEEEMDLSRRSETITPNGVYVKDSRGAFAKGFFLAKALQKQSRLDRENQLNSQMQNSEKQDQQQKNLGLVLMFKGIASRMLNMLWSGKKKQAEPDSEEVVKDDLQEEKERLLTVLRTELERIDEGLAYDMDAQRQTWEKVIEEKKTELEEKKKEKN